MANYVSNSVQFVGDPAKVAQVRELFLQIEAKQAATNRYHLPDFVTGDQGHMLEIEANGEWLNYETRWIPNLGLLEQIARHYNLDFIAKYEEPTNFMYGEAVFTANKLHHAAMVIIEGEDWRDDSMLTAIQDLQASLLSSSQLKR